MYENFVTASEKLVTKSHFETSFQNRGHHGNPGFRIILPWSPHELQTDIFPWEHSFPITDTEPCCLKN